MSFLARHIKLDQKQILVMKGPFTSRIGTVVGWDRKRREFMVDFQGETVALPFNTYIALLRG